MASMDERKGAHRTGIGEEDRHGYCEGTQKILVFQQSGSGEGKIAAVRKHGGERCSVWVISIDDDLPEIIDNPYEFIPQNLKADLVLDFLKHPDLSCDLAVACRDRGIPIIASGKKSPIEEVITPPT